ncbi:MAG: class I SAM-dependent methyltransferase, partial [Candidatus Heimdallarchaeota archaeon]
YDNLILDELDDSCVLTGVDENQDMLKQFENNMKKHGHFNFKTVFTPIENLDNLDLGHYDVVLSFNAIHHFNIGKTLSIINNLLKTDGMAFLYSRTANQNERSIWGQYFPKFNLYESRLYSLSDLEKSIYQVDGLELDEIKFFTYNRSQSIDRLINQAEGRHYSTFSFYDYNEFMEISLRFKQELRQKFINLDSIKWQDRNVMLKIVKT